MSSDDIEKDLAAVSQGDKVANIEKDVIVGQAIVSTSDRSSESGDHIGVATAAESGIPLKLQSEKSLGNSDHPQKVETGSGDHNPILSDVPSSNQEISEHTRKSDCLVEQESSTEGLKSKGVITSFNAMAVDLSADDVDDIDDLVLKYDDDDEEEILGYHKEGEEIKNVEDVDSKLDKDFVLKYDDDDKEESLGSHKEGEEIKKFEDVDSKLDKDPNVDDNITSSQRDERAIVTTTSTSDISRKEISTDDPKQELITGKEIALVTPNSDKEPESLDDSTEDVLDELDAQIAELQASLSKAENENPLPDQLESSNKNIAILPTNESIVLKPEDTEPSSAAIDDSLKSDLVTVESDNNIINNDENVENISDPVVSTQQDDDHDQMDVEEELKTDISSNFNELKDDAYANMEEITPTEDNTLANSTQIEDSSIDMTDVDKIKVSVCDTTVEPREHGLTEPNMMLEIPTQELIDLDESMNTVSDQNMSVDSSLNQKTSPDEDMTKAVEESEVQTSNVENIENHEIQDSHDINSKQLEIIDEKQVVTNLIDSQLEKEKTAEPTTQSDPNKPITNESIEMKETATVFADNTLTKEVIEEEKVIEKIVLEEETVHKDLEILNKNKANTDELIPSNITVATEIVTDNVNLQDNDQDSNVEVKTAKESMDTSADTVKETISNQNETKQDSETAETQELSREDKENNVENKVDVAKDETTLILPAVSSDQSTEPDTEQHQDIVETQNADITQKDEIGKDAMPINEVSKVETPKPAEETMDVQPSTSKAPDVPTISSEMAPDTLDDAADVTDSLGLLAECTPVQEDEEDQETSDHEDDDDDFEPDDDESNMQPDQSEDSAQHSETDAPNKPSASSSDKDNDDTQDVQKFMKTNDALFDSLLESSKELPDQNKGDEKTASVASDENKDDAEMDIEDDIVCDEVEVGPVNLIGDADPTVDEALDATLDAFDAALEEEEKALAEAEASTEVIKPVEATKPSDETSDDVTNEISRSRLKALLLEKKDEKSENDSSKSPSKTKKLEIANQSMVLSIVDLEGSSSEDDVQEVKKKDVSELIKEITPQSASSSALKITPRLNMSEISIKTTSTPKAPLVIPETKISETKEPAKKKFGALEVFNLDSDDEELIPVAQPAAPPGSHKEEKEPEKESQPNRCINASCTSSGNISYHPANGSVRAYYDCNKKRGLVCLNCLYEHHTRGQRLVEGIKNLTPLLELEMSKTKQELVEISDSDSEDEKDNDTDAEREVISEPAVLERQLADMINATWEKYKLEKLFNDAQMELMNEIQILEQEGKEVNQMLDECQIATDKLRKELYSTFEPERHELPAMIIHDAPDKQFTCLESVLLAKEEAQQASKRKLSASEINESKAKKPTVGNDDQTDEKEAEKQDDDKDVSVVNLSVENAPASLPPPGDATRPPLQPGMLVYAMRNAFGSWTRATIVEVTPKTANQQFTMCRLKFEHKVVRNANKIFSGRQLAYCEPAKVRMTIGTRIIALFKDTSRGDKEAFYSGVVAEIPNPVNSYRYLVFFDDGYAQYVQHADTRLVCESSSLVWEEVHAFSREFVKEYLLAYPERPMVRLHTGQFLKTEWNGKWWPSRVIAVDASLVKVYFEQDRRTEWIYRGSTRLAPLYLELQAAEKHRARPLPRNRATNKFNMPYVEYTRSDEPEGAKGSSQDAIKAQQEEIRRQRAVAKKSTAPSNAMLPPPLSSSGNLESVTSRVVYYTPKNAVKPHKMVTHTCGPRCKRTDVLSLKELRTYNPLAKPLLSGWERQIVRYKGHKEVMYRAPCGRRLRNISELHRYLRTINSDMGVDLFDFGPNTHCLAEFVLNKCIVGKKDLSHGKENVPVPCVNYHDNSLPEFCSYNTERTPTAGVPLNLDPDFLCGCDCTDDCEDKSKCACWKLTLEGARTIGLEGDVGYEYKRLPEPLPSGIYECNVRCKCKSTCLNRVAQHPLQLKLQVFKTVNRGWGIRALNDVPKGSFLCIYAGNLLTDATANLDGLNEGDEYLAELDYIEVVEQMKEGYEEDIPGDAKKLDKKESGKSESEESEPSESEEEEKKSDVEDTDFEPAYIPGAVTAFSKRLRKREKKKQKEEEEEKKKKEKEKEKEGGNENEDDCITISDDEEIREPSRFAAQAGMEQKYVSKHRSVRSYFGKDEACYIMDAKVQGNIGRYLNHSCSPNVFVQNVFVDTHDPRFPWVAFFALHHIRAGAELTWNYNYDVGSVPGKALYCYCGADNCRGRLL